MTLGRGLESLIPKGGHQGGQQTSPLKQSGDLPAPPSWRIRQAGEPRNPSSPQHSETQQKSVSSPVPPLSSLPRAVPQEVLERRERHQRRGELERESVFQIEVEKIKPNPYQPRRGFDPEALEELAQSIREYGIIQPLVVSKVVKETEAGADVEYQLITGERRLLAAKKVGLMRVPAIVRRVDAPNTKLELALIENLQRSDLSSLETAKAYARLQDEFGLTQREIAARLGKSREVVANTLRLLNLPGEIQVALADGSINESQARILLSAPGPAEQTRLFRELLAQKTSVRELQRKTRMGTKAPVTALLDSEQRHWEEQLEEKLGAPVKIMGEKDRGRVVIVFFSEEERKALLRRLLGEDESPTYPAL